MKPMTTSYQRFEKYYYDWSGPNAIRKQRVQNILAKRSARRKEKARVAKEIRCQL